MADSYEIELRHPGARTRRIRVIADFEAEPIILTDSSVHTTAGDPPNMKPCKRGAWSRRMVVETALSMLTTFCHVKKLGHRTWTNLNTRIAFTMAVFNVLVQGNGLPIDHDGTSVLEP